MNCCDKPKIFAFAENKMYRRDMVVFFYMSYCQYQRKRFVSYMNFVKLRATNSA